MAATSQLWLLPATTGHQWPPLATIGYSLYSLEGYVCMELKCLMAATGHRWPSLPPLANAGQLWLQLATIGHHWPPLATVYILLKGMCA